MSVTGSVRGAHEGHLEPYSASQGASFVLDTPPPEGEEVYVMVDLAEGGPVEDSFSVATPVRPRRCSTRPAKNPKNCNFQLPAEHAPEGHVTKPTRTVRRHLP